MQNPTAALTAAAHAVLAQLDNGELFAQGEPAISNNVAALDALAEAVSATASTAPNQAVLSAIRASMGQQLGQMVFFPMAGNVARGTLARVAILLTAHGNQVVYIVAIPVAGEMCRFVEADAIYNSAADAFTAMVG